MLKTMIKKYYVYMFIGFSFVAGKFSNNLIKKEVKVEKKELAVSNNNLESNKQSYDTFYKFDKSYYTEKIYDKKGIIKKKIQIKKDIVVGDINKISVHEKTKESKEYSDEQKTSTLQEYSSSNNLFFVDYFLSKESLTLFKTEDLIFGYNHKILGGVYFGGGVSGDFKKYMIQTTYAVN